MAEIENIHCPICTQPIPSSWQNGLPPASATLEQRGVVVCFFCTRHWQISDVKEWFWTWYPNSCNVFLASFSRWIQGSTNNFERKIIQHDVLCQKQGFINIQRIWLLFVLANQNVVNPVSFMWINAQIKKEVLQRINVHFNLLRHFVS